MKKINQLVKIYKISTIMKKDKLKKKVKKVLEVSQRRLIKKSLAHFYNKV
jgi:hypothetical protein